MSQLRQKLRYSFMKTLKITEFNTQFSINTSITETLFAAKKQPFKKCRPCPYEYKIFVHRQSLVPFYQAILLFS